MTDDDKRYALGASRPALEGIRDILLIDYEAVQHSLKMASVYAERLNNGMERLRQDVAEMKDSIDFIDAILKGNANTMITNTINIATGEMEEVEEQS